MSLCDRCDDPGFCCRNIRLTQGPPLGATKLEALAWAATVEPATHEIGVPFLPHRKVVSGNYHWQNIKCPFEEWEWSCPRLTADGRCGDYDNRPTLCRVFEAGHMKPCAMFGRQAAPCDLLLKTYQNPDIRPKT